jgi:UDP-2,3-diacylglucosamine hydrolase
MPTSTLRIMEHEQPERVGLLAAAGRFPIVFADAARQQGLAVYCMGVAGMADEQLRDICDDFHIAPLGRMGRAIRFFKRRQVDRVVMAGKIEKRIMYDPLRLLQNLPDWRALHMWYRYARDNKKDDTLLLAIIREFERDGIQFGSALDFCPELLVKHGFLTRRKPSPQQWKDVRFGWEIAKEMGRLDIGQTVVVNETAIIAVEAIEGTDECIHRAGVLCRRGGFTVIKVAKPQQDRRFDVPTIGLQTIQSMHEAGGRVLAVECGQTILLDEPDVVELANRLGIAIVSLNAEELHLRAVA